MMNVNKEKRLMKRRCSATSAMFGKMLHHNIPAAAATTTARSSSDNKNINIESIINENNNDDEVEPVVNVGTWIIGLMILEKEPSLESVRRTTQERLISKMIRYRSRLIVNNRSTYAHFEEVPEIDWDYHIPDLSSINEKPWTKEQLFEYLGKLNDFNYDMSKPLWRTLLIPKYENGQAAIIMCTSHAIGDGLALVEVLHRMLDESKPSDDNNASQPSVENSSRHKGKRTDAPKSDIVTKIGAFLYGLAYGFVAPILPADPPNKLRPKGYQSSGKKLVAQTKSIELSKINELRSKMQGVTINDVLMALMTLSLKSYYEEIGEFSPSKKITGQFPVSMRKNGESAFDLHGDPHNFISYAYYNFNFQGNRVDAIWNTKNEIDLIKLSPAPIVLQQHTQIGLALLPTNLLMKVLLHAGNMGTAQLSNVPGPQKQVTIFDGIKVNDMSFYLFSPLSMYFGILSYNGIVNAAINLDGSLGVNPNDIAKHWDREFDLLYQDVMEKASKAPNGMLVQPAHYGKENKAFALRVIAIAILLFSLLMMQILRLLLISKDIPTEFKESI